MRITLPASYCAVISLFRLSHRAAEAGSDHFSTEPILAWEADPYQWITDKNVELGVRANLLMIRMDQNEHENTAFALTNNTDTLRSLRIEVQGVPSTAFIGEIRLHTDVHYAYENTKRRCALEIVRFMQAGLAPRTNPDGTIQHHRLYRPEKIYAPGDGGIPHPGSGWYCRMPYAGKEA